MTTLAKNVLRELIADTLREHRAESPGECADAIMDTLRRYAPKSYIEHSVDYTDEDRYTDIAREIMLASSGNVDKWEIQASYPRLTDEEVTLVDDLIGQAEVTVTF